MDLPGGIKAQTERYFNGLCNEITSLDNTVPDRLLQKTQKITEVLGIIDEWEQLLKNIKKTITEEKNSIGTYVQQMDEKLNQVRKSLLPTALGAPPGFTAPLGTPVVTQVPPVPTSEPIKILKRDTNNGWVDVVSKSNRQAFKPTAGAPPASTPLAASVSNTLSLVPRDARKNMPVNREIAPGVYIQAFTIDKPTQCHDYLGWLCYNPDTERFYLSINGEILAGNTTVINSADKTPIKFNEHHDCALGQGHLLDYKDNKFYVPPECNPASRDIHRLTNRMHYAPASQPLTERDKYCYRLGSRENAKADLAALEPKDFRLFQAITSNFLLHFVAAAREMNSRK